MLDMDELDRDPWPTYPVSKDELRKANEVMTKLIKRVEILESALLFYADEGNWANNPSRIDMDGGRLAENILYLGET